MHIKRESIPEKWPVPRKGTPYIVKPSFEFEEGMPLLVVIRDVLKIVSNKKELKKALNEKKVLINSKPAKDYKHGIVLFDTITFVPTKKSYRMELTDKGKFELRDIKDSESSKKISKVIDKKILKGKKVQLNLSDGRNILTTEKCRTNDSLVINLSNGKIEKVLPLKEKSNILVFEGKHAGERGTISHINSERKTVDVEIDKVKVSILIKQIIVIE